MSESATFENEYFVLKSAYKIFFSVFMSALTIKEVVSMSEHYVISL